MNKKQKEIILYIVFGVSTTAVNWIIYTLLTLVLQVGMTLSNGIAWGGAVLFAFVTNKLFVFESKSMKWCIVFKEALLFVGARIFSGVFEVFLPTALVMIGLNQKLWGIDGFWAKVLVSVLVVILNYVVSKTLVFVKKVQDA